jgi:CRP-like cAMP-binding protein
MPQRLNPEDLHLPEDSEIRQLLAACPDIEVYRFADEEYLVRADDGGNDVYLIVRGSCLVENRDAGETRQPGFQLAVVHGEDDAPAFVGEMSYLGGGYRTASVRSAMNTFALRLTPAHIEGIIEKHPFFTRVLCRQFATRLREVNEQLRHYQRSGLLLAEQRFVAPGELICEKGSPALQLFELVDGVVKQEDGDGTRDIYPASGSHSFLEAAAYLSEGRYQSTLRAEGQCILVAISQESRVNVVRNYPELALRVLNEVMSPAKK